jgi:cell division protein FtsZ
MREGPLADLFRSTAEDAPEDPPELEAPRYGREDPAEARRAQEDSRPDPEPERHPEPVSRQAPREPASPVEPQPRHEPETPPERLKRVFSEEPKPQRREVQPIVETPRYGREEPEYEPPGSGEPHQPVIRVVGVGGAGVNAVNRMVDAHVPGVEFMAVNTDLQSLQLSVADITVHIGDEQTRGLGAGADPQLGHSSAFGEQDKIKRLL